MIAPLMTCSARLPVYALIIGAFNPRRTVLGGLELQGVVLFALYILGVAGAMAVAFVLKRGGSGAQFQALMLELPAYHWPNLRNLGIGLWQRVEIFMSRVGTIILSLMVILWALSSFPAPPPGATGPAIQYSIAGHIGAWLAVIFAPIGFNWQISIALVPGLAAREVAVGALGTVYALSATGNDVSGALTPLIAQSWGLPTALLVAGVVRVCTAMPVDPGHGQARNQFLALSDYHGGVPVCDGLCRIVDHLSHCPGIDELA